MTVSDSTGWVYDPDGIDVASIKRDQRSEAGASDGISKISPKCEVSGRNRSMVSEG